LLKASSREAETEILLSGNKFIDLLQAAMDKKASFRFQAKGFSMSPFIKNGDFLTVSALGNADAGIGKIIVCVRPKNRMLIVHRVVGKNKNGYILKGDNIFNIDSLVHYDDVLGVVSSIERNGRPVLFGLGWERVIVAFFSRIKVFPVVSRLWRKLQKTPPKKLISLL